MVSFENLERQDVLRRTSVQISTHVFGIRFFRDLCGIFHSAGGSLQSRYEGDADDEDENNVRYPLSLYAFEW